MTFPAQAPAQAAAAPISMLPENARVLTLSLLPGGNDDDLRGEVCSGGRTCSSVPYPYLLRAEGVELLDQAIRQPLPTPEQPHQIVFGYSQGARVAADWIAQHAGTEDAPSPEHLSFVLIGNPGRKYGGAHVGWGQTVPDSDYQILDVARQYDMAADMPDRFNLLALANVLAGFMFIHADYEEVDLYDPRNYVWKEGNTTYVFIPTENLPLLEPLRWLGLTGIADALNGPLKAIVEDAYDRSYLPAEPGLPSEPEPTPEPDPEPTPEPDPETPQTDPAPESETTTQSLTIDEDDQGSIPEEAAAEDEQTAAEEQAAQESEEASEDEPPAEEPEEAQEAEEAQEPAKDSSGADDTPAQESSPGDASGGDE
jgi:hypothetical protein